MYENRQGHVDRCHKEGQRMCKEGKQDSQWHRVAQQTCKKSEIQMIHKVAEKMPPRLKLLLLQRERV
jgi:hypothetical protein